MNQGYFSQPTLSQTHIAFISDDDLWLVERAGGVAQRLTANRGFVSSPVFSPDGRYIAFLTNDSSAENDVYILPSAGGEMTRLTWLGVSRVVGWKDAETIYFTSGIEAYPRRTTCVYELNIKTHDFKKVDLGPMSFYYQGSGFQVLARNSSDSARWKRYQGGTAGVIWTQQGKAPFKRILQNIKTNLTRPVVIGRTLYFISDFEGIGNVYSCDLSGQNLKRLTHHIDYYCRNLAGYENTLVYQAGAEIFTYDLSSQSEAKVHISCATTAMQTVERYDNWARSFDSAAISPDLTQTALVVRGQIYQMAPFAGPVKQLDRAQNVRYTHLSYNYDSTQILAAVATVGSADSLVLIEAKTGRRQSILQQMNWGKIWEIKASPVENIFAVVNNRQEVYLVNTKKSQAQKIETSNLGRPHQFDWSPDGRYLAYTMPLSWFSSRIRIYDTEKSKLNYLMQAVCSDSSPSFDPDGKYLYFIGVREYAPNYYETHFDLGFVFAKRPYVVALNSQSQNPFEKPFENMTLPEKNKDKKKTKTKKPEKCEIEFEGINNRILPFKLPLGGYSTVMGVHGGLLYLKNNVEPISENQRFAVAEMPSLCIYKFEDGTSEVLQKNARTVCLNLQKTHALVFDDSKLRLIDLKNKPSTESKIGKKDGYLDTARLKVKISPKQEWQQMYHEAWILQKEHFWRKDMSQVSWDLVYKRYQALLPKVKTRSELSDLIWEMQGELGTSHSYEMLGDYDRRGSGVLLGKLGAYFSFNTRSKKYQIERLLKGDSWILSANSPLTAMGVSLKEGDQIAAVDGVSFEYGSDLYRFLENKADQKVELDIIRQGSAKIEKVIVKATRSLAGAWYRDWVESNRKYIHEKSKGKIGYVHVPDMGVEGFAEFYRSYNQEHDYEGLVIDVRYNGGGHVSQHLLKVLAQKVLGFDETRYQGLIKYPAYASGALVAISNEFSGSDGDIFPHSFKLMKLGKLVGKRTWGGVIGINGQYDLRDNSYITQPEYSYWFKDNEWKVENHGVDPDIEVDITPENYRDGVDPQLDTALKEVLADLKKKPNTKFKPTYYPDLSTPRKLGRLKTK